MDTKEDGDENERKFVVNGSRKERLGILLGDKSYEYWVYLD